MLPEAGGQVVQDDGCLEPGEVQPREQPLPVAKGGEGAAAATPMSAVSCSHWWGATGEVVYKIDVRH
jgi:hypothetical protein